MFVITNELAVPVQRPTPAHQYCTQGPQHSCANWCRGVAGSSDTGRDFLGWDGQNEVEHAQEEGRVGRGLLYYLLTSFLTIPALHWASWISASWITMGFLLDQAIGPSHLASSFPQWLTSCLWESHKQERHCFTEKYKIDRLFLILP